MRVINWFVCLLMLFAGSAQAKTYTNDSYRFSVDLPIGKTICGAQGVASDHGIAVLLNSSDCSDRAATYVGIFASFNIPYEARTTAEVARDYCREAPRPSDIKIGRLTFYRCGKPANFDGVEYVSLRRDVGDWQDDWIVIHLDLVCPNHDCAAYERLLRKVAAGVRLH